MMIIKLTASNMTDESERIESEVLQWLRQVDVDGLQKIGGELNVDIPEDKKGNKYFVLKLILRYLHSAELEGSEDQGLSTFLQLHSDLSEIIKKGLSLVEDGQSLLSKTVKIEKVEQNLRDKTIEFKNNSQIKVQTRREFKINGSVGGEKDSLSYISLSFQMGQGRKAGYTHAEIQAAVIRAIKPGSSLRNYLESREDIEDAAFIQVLRSHYKEKNSASVFHEMSNAAQLQSESELDFCLRVMSLRQKVMSLSTEEGYPFDETLVRKRFFQAIDTGLKYNNMRVQLHGIFKAALVSDEELLHEISVASCVELEHINKVKLKTSVSKVESTVKNSEKNENEKTKKDNILLSEINQLNAKVNELSSVHDEIRDIKKQLANFPFSDGTNVNKKKSNFDGRQNHRRIFRCQICEKKNNNFCNHCFQCGAFGHRRNQCTNSKNE